MNIGKVNVANTKEMKNTLNLDCCNGKKKAASSKNVAFKASQPLKLDTFKKA